MSNVLYVRINCELFGPKQMVKIGRRLLRQWTSPDTFLHVHFHRYEIDSSGWAVLRPLFPLPSPTICARVLLGAWERDYYALLRTVWRLLTTDYGHACDVVCGRQRQRGLGG